MHDLTPDWHCIEIEEVLALLDASENGLTQTDARKRLLDHGPNIIPEKPSRSLLILLAGQFTDFMIVVLLLAALISRFIGELQDTIVCMANWYSSGNRELG